MKNISLTTAEIDVVLKALKNYDNHLSKQCKTVAAPSLGPDGNFSRASYKEVELSMLKLEREQVLSVLDMIDEVRVKEE